MSLPDVVYDAGIQIARPLLAVAAPLSAKLRAGVHGRRGAVDRLTEWAQTARDARRSLVWLHAPSVGESLMAKAIIAELRARVKDVQVVFTHFSPSAERVAQQVGADIAGYLPWDTHSAMQRALTLQPGVIAFVRTEIWPALVRASAARGSRLALVNAALAPNSSRLRGTSRWLLGGAYRQLDRVGAIARPDAERFSRLGVDPARVSVTGDARFDQVHARVQRLDREQPLLKRLHDDRFTSIVAGSTWPADEAELIPAFAAARKGSPLRLIIAPHEPDSGHLRGLEQRLDDAGVRHARLAEIEASERALPDVVVVDRVGVLADLYAIATVAYVGGGFHGAGLHSIIEPAVLGVPVIFGPRHGNAREADELAGRGGGFVASDGQTFASLVLDLADRPIHRKTASAAARAYVLSKLGGARRNAELIAGLL
ncbi:MAG: 3-deoxy-D-manno-octulosonic acid transferase [Gemmatimonadota bacterium]